MLRPCASWGDRGPPWLNRGPTHFGCQEHGRRDFRFGSLADIGRRLGFVRFVPCVDGSVLASQNFTSQRWSVQPCVRPVDAVHMTAGHNALRGSGPGH